MEAPFELELSWIRGLRGILFKAEVKVQCLLDVIRKKLQVGQLVLLDHVDEINRLPVGLDGSSVLSIFIVDDKQIFGPRNRNIQQLELCAYLRVATIHFLPMSLHRQDSLDLLAILRHT